MPLAATAIRRFSDGLPGEVIRPGDTGYDEARAVWNGMIDRYPALVVRPTGADDVASAIRFAREHELMIAVRSGGHSIPGLSPATAGSSSTCRGCVAYGWIPTDARPE